jgi:hypothetical protein
MKKKQNASERRELAEFRKAMVKTKAKRTAYKITALIFDPDTPQFLMESMMAAIHDAGRELGILDEWGGYWPFNPKPDREIAKNLEIIEEICLKGGSDYELKGAQE